MFSPFISSSLFSVSRTEQGRNRDREGERGTKTGWRDIDINYLDTEFHLMVPPFISSSLCLLLQYRVVEEIETERESARGKCRVERQKMTQGERYKLP